MTTTQGKRHDAYERIRRNVVKCTLCPRLTKYRRSVMPRASYSSQEYWRRPVPGFGDVNGRLLVIGLSPAAHGGNRTGRVFTGDNSGRFLVSALFSAGYANKPVSESKDDGLVYRDCYLTAAVKCAPPGDRPSPSEFANCSAFLDDEIAMLTNVRAVLALGSLAFDAYLKSLQRRGVQTAGKRFAHGGRYEFDGYPMLYASYHPSPRNTNTGRLTKAMLTSVLEEIVRYLNDSSPG